MRLRCGDERFEARVRDGGGTVEVSLGERTFGFGLESVEPGVFVVRRGTAAVTFHLARDGEVVHLFWDGVVYALAEEREGARAAPRPDAGTLEAPMPGRVAAVAVAVGQRVARGDELVVVEAMKMENALRAPREGVVRAIHVAPGDSVAPGRPLLDIE
jgi:biotin carboxyl carrier protein